MTKVMRKLTALGLVAVLAVAGCGSSRLSPSAFRTRAEAICVQMKAKGNTIDTTTPRGFARGIAILDAGIRRLDGLRPPEAAASTYSDFLSNLKRTVALIKRDQPELMRLTKQLTAALPGRINVYGPSPFKSSRYRARLRREIRLVRQLLRPVRAAATAARRLELKQCAKGLD